MQGYVSEVNNVAEMPTKEEPVIEEKVENF